MYVILMLLAISQVPEAKPRFMPEPLPAAKASEVASAKIPTADVYLYVGIDMPRNALPGSIRVQSIPNVPPGLYRCYRETSAQGTGYTLRLNADGESTQR